MQIHENLISDETQVKRVRLEGNHLLAVPVDFDYMVKRIIFMAGMSLDSVIKSVIGQQQIRMFSHLLKLYC